MEFDNEELYKWIDEHPLSRPKRNISRDFSDARKQTEKNDVFKQTKNFTPYFFLVPLVEILKHHFPKRVEMHNYSPQNAFNRKLNNWQTLNRKVLSKLGMGLSEDVLENLANAKCGAIEIVLHDVKRKIEKLENRQDGDKSEIFVVEGMSASSGRVVKISWFVWAGLMFFFSVGSLVIPVKVKNGNKVQNKKMVPVEVYDKMEMDLKQKDEKLIVLQEKVGGNKKSVYF